MKIAIAGSHGLIGTNLVTHFRKSNNNVSRIVRSKEQNGIYWNPVTGYINHENLEGYDVIINLCGEKIASLNPFFKNKSNLISSRVTTNMILSKTIAKLNNPPKFFITASATGIYKPSKRRIIESSNKIRLPSDISSPTLTRSSTTVPSCGEGISIEAFSLSIVIKESSLLIDCPMLANISITSTLL